MGCSAMETDCSIEIPTLNCKQQSREGSGPGSIDLLSKEQPLALLGVPVSAGRMNASLHARLGFVSQTRTVRSDIFIDKRFLASSPRMPPAYLPGTVPSLPSPLLSTQKTKQRII